MCESIPKLPMDLSEHITKFGQCLPSGAETRQKIISMYRNIPGYQFLDQKSKLQQYYQNVVRNCCQRRKSQMQMDNELSLLMEGNIEELSVGAMCEIVKENGRKGLERYCPAPDDAQQRIFVFERDTQLQDKSLQLLHLFMVEQISKLGDKLTNQEKSDRIEKNFKISEIQKQMTMREDGSVGPWSSSTKKYTGLGMHNQYTDFRREQSLHYYQGTKQGKQRKNL